MKIPFCIFIIFVTAVGFFSTVKLGLMFRNFPGSISIGLLSVFRVVLICSKFISSTSSSSFEFSMEAIESELLIEPLMISSSISSLKYWDFPRVRSGRE